MNPVSDNIAVTARKIESLILQRLADRTQSAVASELGISEPAVTRLKGSEKEEGAISKISKLLSALDLKVVTESTFTVEPTVFKATEALALEYLKVKVAREKEQDQIIEYYKNKYGGENEKATN